MLFIQSEPYRIITGTLYHTSDWGEKFFDKFGIKFSSHTQHFDETLDAFDKISFDVDLSEIKIITGNGYHISYKCTENLTPEYEIKEGTLYVTQTSQNPHFPKRNGNDNCEIIITISCNMGSIELEGN